MSHTWPHKAYFTKLAIISWVVISWVKLLIWHKVQLQPSAFLLYYAVAEYCCINSWWTSSCTSSPYFKQWWWQRQLQWPEKCLTLTCFFGSPAVKMSNLPKHDVYVSSLHFSKHVWTLRFGIRHCSFNELRIKTPSFNPFFWRYVRFCSSEGKNNPYLSLNNLI